MINFSLVILEYTNSEELIPCEQKVIDLLKLVPLREGTPYKPLCIQVEILGIDPPNRTNKSLYIVVR
jgi:hypothetical protein